jgi:hypothetical protein
MPAYFKSPGAVLDLFVSTSNPPSTTRTALLAFKSPTFAMPAGLELIDDLEYATGGWEQ